MRNPPATGPTLSLGLSRVLGGHAPCSASLRVLSLSNVPFCDQDFFQLAAALSEPKSVWLHTLEVSSGDPGIVGVVALLEALQQHAGGS